MSRNVIVKRAFDTRLFFGLALALLAALLWSSVAQAQSADDQYETPTAPSGPVAEEPATVEEDDDGVVGPGDIIIIEGDFVVADGASVTLQDSDGTQGTLIDDVNAVITEGSIIITVTDFPINVSGGNGVLNTDGLFVVATTGITAADDAGGGAVEDDAAGGGVAGADDASSGAVAAENAEEPQPAAVGVAGVLPDTGGFMLFGVLSALALIGIGALMLGGRFSRQQ